MKLLKINYIKTFFLGIGLILIVSGVLVVNGKGNEYQFSQLDPYFEKDLFGLMFDYNSFISQDRPNQALSMLSDLITNIELNDSTDLDEQEDNIIAMVGHRAKGFNSAIFGIKQVKRTQNVFWFDDPISWQSPMPFTKIIHQFMLPTGETVILGTDFLGICLKINDTNFNPSHYQLGYANLPVDLIETLKGEKISNEAVKFNQIAEFSDNYPPFDMKIEVTDLQDRIKIDYIYLNPTYLFHTGIIDFFKVELADHFVIAQFDEIKYSFDIRKYLYDEAAAGVETISEISIGKVINLIINEELPKDSIWENAFVYEVEEEFPGVFDIDESFAWYQGSDIIKRVNLFSDISFSVITAQSIGIINGTESYDDVLLYIDGQNKTKEALIQDDYPVNDKISSFANNKLISMSQVHGMDYAVQYIGENEEASLIKVNSQTIALNQHYGFSHNNLFLGETSILRDLIADSLKHFINDPIISSQTADSLFNIAGLYLPSAYYIQEFEVTNWTSTKLNLNLLQFAAQESSFNLDEVNRNEITDLNVFPGIIAFVILSIIVKKSERKEKMI